MEKTSLIVLGILFLTLASATFYPEPWGNNQDANNQNLTNVDYITANYFNGTLTGENLGNMNWTYLQNYPVACPSESYLTQLGDSVVCSEISGNINVTNITATRIALDKYGVSAYLNESATTTTTSADTWYPVNGTFINEIMEGFWLNVTVPADPSIVYNGTETQYFDIYWSASGSSDTPATTVYISARNGADPDNWVTATLCKTAGEKYALSGMLSINLSQGDRVQLVIKSDQAGGIIDITHFVTIIRESFA